MNTSTSIAIIGMSGRFPGAADLDAFWRNLREGVDSIRRFTPDELIESGVPPELARDPRYMPAKGILDDIAGFDAGFFGYSPREAAHMDPQHRIFLECVWEALEHAGYDPTTFPGAIGLYAGCGDATYLYHLLQPEQYLAEAAKETSMFFGNYRDFFATRIAYRLNLRGPCIGIQTACSTSLVAINTACSALLSYQCDMAVAGGIHISVPHKSGNLHEPGSVVSPDGRCRAFDAAAAGTVASDGAGAVILKRLSEALDDGDTIHAVIPGGAVNNDGSEKIGYTAPSVDGQAEVIAMAQEMAGIAPGDVSYIEAHGTGTPLGDPIEIKALTKAFRRATDKKGYCAIGSLKTNLGHLDAAAGVAGLIKTVLALRHGFIPPSLNFTQSNPEIDFANSPFFVNNRLREWTGHNGPRIAGVSSFGMGGTNAHTIVMEAPPYTAGTSAKPFNIFILSARTESALAQSARNLAAHLDKHTDPDNVAFTLQTGRHSFPYRLALVTANSKEAAEVLRDPASGTVYRGHVNESHRSLAFLFPGQGLQHVNMGRALYEHEMVFKQHLDNGAELAKPHLEGFDIRTLLYPQDPDKNPDLLGETRYAQPALFLVEFALARHLESFGIRADAMLGHSTGEWVAACLANVLSFEDAVRLICLRGRFMHAAPPGSMAGVELSEEELRPMLSPDLKIAVYNAPRWLVVSGPPESLKAMYTRLNKIGIPYRPLRINHAFHSAAMDTAARLFEEAVSDTRLSPPEQPFISNITGTWITGDQACSAAYWASQIRSPVRFHQGLSVLLETPDRVLVEAGPGRALSRFAAQLNLTEKKPECIPLWPAREQDSLASTLKAVGHLWTTGVDIKWAALHTPGRQRRIPLPTYPFEHQRYWVDVQPRNVLTPPKHQSTATADSEGAQHEEKAPGKKPDISDWFYIPSWEQSPLPDAPSRQKTSTLVLNAPDHTLSSILSGLDDPVVIRKGPTFRQLDEKLFELPPDNRQAYEKLFELLNSTGQLPDRILHAGNFTESDPETPDAEQANSRYLELLALAQAIGKMIPARPVELVLLVNRLCHVHQEDIIAPDKAVILGPAKVIPLEYQNVKCRVVDVDEKTLEHAEYLASEFNSPANDRVAAWRAGRRWTETYRVEPLEHAVTPAHLRENGVYIITGGLGGVGMALAEYLARKVRARLVLVNRSPFPEREQWKKTLESELLPELPETKADILEAEQTFTRELAVREMDDYPGLSDTLKTLSARCILRYFTSVIKGPVKISLPELRQRLEVLPAFDRMFRLMIKIVDGQEGIRREGETLHLPPPLPVPVEETAARYPEFSGLISFIDHCTGLYQQALSGKIPAVQVLYPDGKTDIVDQMQRDTIEYGRQRIYSHVLLEFLKPIAVNRRLRILEIGGGQGLLTKIIAPELIAADATYHFTDISRFFVQRFSETAKGMDGLSTGVFDITRDPAEQDLNYSSFDVVVGLNVVHATRDISKTIANLRKLLTPSGYLCMLETVATGPWVDLCWGLADGWWHFEDTDLRNTSPLMPPEKWEKILTSAGFAHTLTLPKDETGRARSDVALMIAQTAPAPLTEHLQDWQAESSQTPLTVVRHRIRKLMALEKAGASVEVYSGDVTDSKQIKGIVAETTKKFGPIHGVIHSALVLEDGLMQIKDPLSALRVLAPKIQGSIALLDAVRDQPLDFFAHCSSLASVMGLYAQSDYCAATAFQDALAYWMKTCRSLSINWGVWREAGAAMRMKMRALPHATSWEPAAGPVFRRRTVSDKTVFEGELTGCWIMSEHRLNSVPTMPGTGYLALLREAIGKNGVALCNVAFCEPLTAPDERPRRIRLLKEKNQFRLAGLQADEWIEHARGEIRQAEQPHSGKTMPDLQKQFGFREPATDLDAEMDCHGMRAFGPVEAGPRWHRLLRWKKILANEALGLIELPEEYAADLYDFPLHPAMLDVATSFAMGNEENYLPIGYERVQIYRDMTRRIWSHVTWERNTDSHGETIEFDVTIHNDDGTIAIQIENYALRRVQTQPAAPDAQAKRLIVDTPGLLDSLKYIPAPSKQPGPGEVEIRVVATGLNFLDVLSALGMSLKLSDGETGLGRECVGFVSAVGTDVQGFKPGDKVMALAAGSFDDYALAPEICVRLKPDGMKWEEAATFPVAFMTAHFALHHKARLSKGESVLIHAAAGGVGLAAVQLAKLTGAEIFATAGNEDKRLLLQKLGVASVFDSRSDQFMEGIRQATGGRGVDVVLNSLGGELMEKSMTLLAPYGRFLELGKRDFAENRTIGLSVFAKGASYFAVNLSPEIPGYSNILDEVMDMLNRKLINPLPWLAFPVEETAGAFKFMAAGKHKGKLVVTRSAAAVRRHTPVSFEGIDAPMEDAQLRAGMSSAEGAEAFARALNSKNSQVLVSTQDFPVLLRLNTPEQVRRTKESEQVEPVKHPSVKHVPADQPVKTEPVVRDNGIMNAITEAWGKFLGISKVEPDDNFFALGGDSLIGIQIMAHLRKKLGIDVPVAAFFESPTPRRLAQTLERPAGRNRGEPEEQTKLTPRPEDRYKPFPLTDVQQAYWVGRSAAFELGNVAAHGYFEVERRDLDYPRFSRVWMKLVRRHDLLRMVVRPDGNQQVLSETPDYEPRVIDLRDSDAVGTEKAITGIRKEMANQILPSDRWPLFDIRVSLLSDNMVRIHMSFDALIMDAWSSMILGREFSALYNDSTAELPELELTFRDCVLAEQEIRKTGFHEKSKRYWLDRLDSLPPAPDLPLAINPEGLDNPRFTRREARLPEQAWISLKKRAANAGLTPSVICLAAFGEVLARWSSSPHFTINLTLFNRPMLHPQINDVVGDFTSLTLLEMDAGNAAPFLDRAGDVQKQLGHDLDHGRFSGVQVLRELVRTGHRNSGAIMPVVFTSTLALENRQTTHSPVIFDGKVVYGISQTPQVWLDHGIVEEDGELLLNWNAVENLFPENMLDDMFTAYQSLLADLAVNDSAWSRSGTLIELPRLGQRSAYNATRGQKPEQRIETRFFEQAVHNGEKLALITSAGEVSHAELLREAGSIAAVLKSDYSLEPGECVGVHLKKGPRQIAAVLGILRAGGAYVPLDPDLPRERLDSMCQDMRLALSAAGTTDLPARVKTIPVDSIPYGGTAISTPPDVNSLAYVIYTSGSTGQPKGVMIRHYAAINTIDDINQRFEISAADRVFAISSLSFDLSVYDIFGLLSAGGALVMPDPEALRDPGRWHAMMTDRRVTVWNSVPALMELLVDYVETNRLRLPDSLRLILLSGDWIPATLPDRIRKLLPDTQIVSLGGATEASIWSIYYPIDNVPDGWTSIPYGFPLRNQEYYVLNNRMEECPEWVPGELYIGGDGLADGYRKDQEQTEKSFIVHRGKPLYRTGDIGRFRPEGWIEFIGRNDTQIKIQGYRIETGEIETVLRKHPRIAGCAVKAVGQTRGEKKIAAYYIAQAAGPDLTTGELRRFAEQHLPDYMVPHVFIPVGKIPLTVNGKIDYSALPDAPAVKKPATATAKRGENEQRLLRAIAETLKLPAVSLEDNLLDLGADSITMIRIANRIQSDCGVRPPIAELYRMHSINELLANCATPLTGQQGAAADETEYKLILDPDKRLKFKESQPGLRRFCAETRGIALQSGVQDTRIIARSSHRHFTLRPVPAKTMGKFLSTLRQIDMEGKPKYIYPSAGGLYPVQTYLFAKAGRIESIAEGLYYYDPTENRLVPLTSGAIVQRDIFDPLVNRPIYDESAFCLFFIAFMAAVQPMYGEHGARLASIEAGLMAQALDMAAVDLDLGLCHIGDLEFEKIRAHFQIDTRYRWVLSLLGGQPPENQPSSDATERLAQRVKELSPEQLKSLLEARQGKSGQKP